MVIGIDLDNTIICYDGLFYRAAVERGMMPADGPYDKQGVRNWFVQRDREDDFTLLQGYVYGPALPTAKPYPGVLEQIRYWKQQGETVVVVSHKTEIPHRGPAYDLRGAAMDWLEEHNLFARGMLEPADVYLESTMEDKARRVAELGCTHFIDDMEKFLAHPLFPNNTEPWLFSPLSPTPNTEGRQRVFASWENLAL